MKAARIFVAATGNVSVVTVGGSTVSVHGLADELGWDVERTLDVLLVLRVEGLIEPGNGAS